MTAYRTTITTISGMVALVLLAAVSGWLSLPGEVVSVCALSILGLGTGQAWKSRGEAVAKAGAESGHVVRRAPPAGQ